MHVMGDQDNTMEDQEKTLDNMLQARDLHHKYHRHDEDSSVNNSDTCSMISQNTNITTLTTFEFDATTTQTAVYKRCMQRRGG